jgi:hypothetical protein
VNPISILAESAQRVPTPIETPKENENQLVQYVGKVREREASDNSRPYLQPVNVKSPVAKPFEGLGNILRAAAELKQQNQMEETIREKMLKAAEERQRIQKAQLVIIPEPPEPEEPAPVQAPLKPLPGWEDEPEPLLPQPPPPPKGKKKSKPGTAQRLSEYDKETILKISKDSGVVLSATERAQNKQLLIENVSNRLNPKAVLWDSYSKLKGKK